MNKTNEKEKANKMRSKWVLNHVQTPHAVTMVNGVKIISNPKLIKTEYGVYSSKLCIMYKSLACAC